MKVSVRLFARARDLADCEQVTLELPDDATVGSLRSQLADRFPSLAVVVPALLGAVNSEHVTDGTSLTPDSEVACFPPVSGG